MSKLNRPTSSAQAPAEPRPAKMVQAASRSYSLGRPDRLTAQRVEVGLVLNTMLGAEAASAYLARQSVSAKIAQRVLSASGRRRRSDDVAKSG